MNTYELNKIRPEAVLMIYSSDSKKRKSDPKMSVALLKDKPLDVGDVFSGTSNNYTVGEIIERRPSTVSTHDYVTFIATT